MKSPSHVLYTRENTGEMQHKTSATAYLHNDNHLFEDTMRATMQLILHLPLINGEVHAGLCRTVEQELRHLLEGKQSS